jgi:hypothetical protein
MKYDFIAGSNNKLDPLVAYRNVHHFVECVLTLSDEQDVLDFIFSDISEDQIEAIVTSMKFKASYQAKNTNDFIRTSLSKISSDFEKIICDPGTGVANLEKVREILPSINSRIKVASAQITEVLFSQWDRRIDKKYCDYLI